MKILIISNMYPSIKDPVYGTFVESFVKQMIDMNGYKSTKILVIKGRTNNIFIKFWKYFAFYLRIIINLLCYKFDLIYVHTITYPIPPIRIVNKFKYLPLVFNVHGGDVLTRSRVADMLKKQAIPLLKKSKLIISPSNYFKDILLSEFSFLTSDKIFVSPSGGIDSSFFFVNKLKPSSLFTIGYVSRIDNKKGWDTFIEAISILKSKGYVIYAYMAGRGNQTKDLVNMINNKSLNEYIEYIGPVPYNELPLLYSKLDLFVFPTQLKESLGLVGLEAMAKRVPVVGSHIGGLTDYLISGHNGFFFEAGNSKDLANKIEKYLLLSSDEKDIFRNNAFATACQYSSEKVKKDLYLKLKSII